MTRRTPHTPPPRRKVPAFVPVPLRARCDGWTPLRQAEFLGYLAETRSVAEAARRVNMARETAYRLRRLPGAESFHRAWDAAMGRGEGGLLPARKVTGYELYHRAFHGMIRPVMRGGKFSEIEAKADSSALLRLVAQPHLGRIEPAVRSRKNSSGSCSILAEWDESFTSPFASANLPAREE